MRRSYLSDVEETEVTEKDYHKGAFDSDDDVSDDCEKNIGPRVLTATEALSRKFSKICKQMMYSLITFNYFLAKFQR